MDSNEDILDRNVINEEHPFLRQVHSCTVANLRKRMKSIPTECPDGSKISEQPESQDIWASTNVNERPLGICPFCKHVSEIPDCFPNDKSIVKLKQDSDQAGIASSETKQPETKQSETKQLETKQSETHLSCKVEKNAECDNEVESSSGSQSSDDTNNDVSDLDDNSFFSIITVPRWEWLSEKESFTPETDRIRHDRSSVHHVADSYFSSSSGFTNFGGFFNLCIILMVLSNTRVALENVIKYGILIDPFYWTRVFFKEPYSWPCLSVMLLTNVFISVCLIIERLISKGVLSETSGWLCHTINILLEISVPAIVVWILHPFPVFSSFCLGMQVIVFLKLISYVQVNSWCRNDKQNLQSMRKRRKTTSVQNFRILEKTYDSDSDVFIEDRSVKLEPSLQYPNNLTFRDIYYFMFAPTLCYELKFPRSARIRKRFLLKRIAEMLFLFGLMLGLIQQWIAPTVKNSMVPFHNLHLTKIVERLLKLAVPNHLIWLIFFYWLFHSCLNVVAEIMKFGDRTFYRDWWNATTVQYFWQHWNVPVHKWAVRHVYKPAIKYGVTKKQAGIIVFMVSAFFHEYLVSVPLQMFRAWSFLAMIGQVPMAVFVKRHLHGKYGNMAVWLSLIIGQPMALLMYYHDYYILNHGRW